MIHQPVLLKEVLKFLDPKTGENFIDCTIGGGGHTAAILKKNEPEGKVLGIETDIELYKKLQAAEIKNQKSHAYRQAGKIKNRLVLVNDSFTNLEKIIKEHEFGPVNGVLLDLGLSSWHLEKSGRGFTFKKDEPLLMNFGPSKLIAREIINQWSEEDLGMIFGDYGQERFARRIALKIVQGRKFKPIKTTFQLVETIKRAIPKKYRYGRIHFATRTFQALRIVVNEELDGLKKVLPQALRVLARRGHLIVISFHSLEDRIVKIFLRDMAREEQLEILTKKPVVPSQEEIVLNSRSRSAKLRAAIKK